MKVFKVSLLLAIVAISTHAKASLVISKPFNKGECQVAYNNKGTVLFKLLKQSEAAKHNQTVTNDSNGTDCSEKLKSDLGIDKATGCQVLCNENQ